MTLQTRKFFDMFRHGQKRVVDRVLGILLVLENLVGHVEHQTPVGLIQGDELVPVLWGVDDLQIDQHGPYLLGVDVTAWRRPADACHKVPPPSPG